MDVKIARLSIYYLTPLIVLAYVITRCLQVKVIVLAYVIPGCLQAKIIVLAKVIPGCLQDITCRV